MNTYQVLANAIDFQLGKKFLSTELTQIQQVIVDHADLADAAEYHGVAPFFYDFIVQHKLTVPVNFYRQIQSLMIRHKLAASAREKIITQVITVFQKNKIDLILLKGISLAYSIYPHPQYRPMRDIDILISETQLPVARLLLIKNGFVFDEAHPSIFMRGMHHLPNAIKRQEGLDISLEVHHQIYSRDNAVRQSYPQARVTAQRQALNDSCETLTLDHVSMLTHLCHHSFGPADEVRLIHQFDIVNYARKFSTEIPWEELNAKHPFITNTIRCLHYSLTLPPQITERINMPERTLIDDVGKALMPYTKLFNNNLSFSSQVKAVFFPSVWWMHVNYSIPPENSLFWCYVFHHPKRVIKDVLIRINHAIGNKVKGVNNEY